MKRKIHEIIKDILVIISKNPFSFKSKIKKKSRAGHNLFNLILNELLNEKLVSKNGEKYFITQKGIENLMS